MRVRKWNNSVAELNAGKSEEKNSRTNHNLHSKTLLKDDRTHGRQKNVRHFAQTCNVSTALRATRSLEVRTAYGINERTRESTNFQHEFAKRLPNYSVAEGKFGMFGQLDCNTVDLKNT